MLWNSGCHFPVYELRFCLLYWTPSLYFVFLPSLLWSDPRLLSRCILQAGHSGVVWGHCGAGPIGLSDQGPSEITATSIGSHTTKKAKPPPSPRMALHKSSSRAHDFNYNHSHSSLIADCPWGEGVPKSSDISVGRERLVSSVCATHRDIITAIFWLVGIFWITMDSGVLLYLLCFAEVHVLFSFPAALLRIPGLSELRGCGREIY